MNYRVDWTEEAEQQLAAIWTTSSDQAEITAAARRIERRLGLNPLTQGESRTDFDVRILFDGPLAVLYHVDVFGMSAIVVSVGPNPPVDPTSQSS